MEPKTHLFSLSAKDRDAFVRRCSTSAKHLQNVAYGYRPPSSKLATAVERESGSAVTRAELRPDDFADIWPDLAAQPA